MRRAFYNRVIRYHQAHSIQIQQTTACDALHSVEQRFWRWLLMSRERAGTDELKLTQEFMAIMLGVRRPTVTATAGALRKAGLIADGQRGTINIIDGAGLEAASCECYASVKANFSRMMPEMAVPVG